MTKDEALKLALEALEINLVFLRNVKPFKGQEDLASDCVSMTDEIISAIKEALAQPEALPWTNKMSIDVPNQILYTAPQRTWVGLTPQERDEINQQVYGAVPHHVAFHHAIEAKLKEKNT